MDSGTDISGFMIGFCSALGGIELLITLLTTIFTIAISAGANA